MIDPDGIDRIFALARTKSDLHRAIDALPDGAAMIVVANACCCGDPTHEPNVGSAVFHLACGSPSLSEAPLGGARRHRRTDAIALFRAE